MTSHPSIAAVVVTYQCDAGIAAALERLLGEVQQIYVVDNGSDAPAITAMQVLATQYPSRIIVILNPDNVGIAAAQNQGIKQALATGLEWVLFMDQDSTPAPGMIGRMLAAWREENNPRLGIIAPLLVEQNAPIPARYLTQWGIRKALKPGDHFLGAVRVIASGSLVRCELFRAIGLMEEAFFIDYVDHEFCLRARRQGYRILIAGDALLYHRQGHKQRHHVLGLTVTASHYPASRYYTIVRNRLWVLRRYGSDFLWLWPHELAAFGWDIGRMLLFETNKGDKLAAIWRGMCEGLGQTIPNSSSVRGR